MQMQAIELSHSALSIGMPGHFLRVYRFAIQPVTLPYSVGLPDAKDALFVTTNVRICAQLQHLNALLCSAEHTFRDQLSALTAPTHDMHLLLVS